jgi:hypothetical protein
MVILWGKTSAVKKIIVLFLLALVPIFSMAQTGPEIKFETETIDYGDIAKGSDGIRTFVFQNTGDAPLIIQSVRSSCGCTIPKKPEDPIAPGAKNEIQVKYDTNRVGVFRKTITVGTNATGTAIVALKIKGNVLAP